MVYPPYTDARHVVDWRAAESKFHGSPTRYCVAVTRWFERDEMAEGVVAAIRELGHHALLFDARGALPPETEVVFSFGPFGHFLPLAQQVKAIPASKQPIIVQWNTEGMPDLRLPWTWVYPVSQLRSFAGRLATGDGTSKWKNRITSALPESIMLRYRYVGDYYYAMRHNMLDVFADLSAVYAGIHNQHGLQTTRTAWGSVPAWYADFGLKRDIDVLWMGKRGTKRRSDLLDGIRQELRENGVQIYMADNEERPFVFREERTELLNRTKIVLNLTRTWYDDNFVRFGIVAPNRCLIVSEPLLPHSPEYVPNEHYIAAAHDVLASTILRYLRNEEERQRVVNNAYSLVTNQLTMVNSVRKIMEQVDAKRRSHNG